MSAATFHRLVRQAILVAGFCAGWSVAAGADSGAAQAASDAATAAAGAAGAVADMDEDEEDEYALPPVRDPFERVNRSVFKFNDGVLRHVIRPVTRGYEKVTPAPLRRGLGSFFDNVRFPVRFAGCVLQGKLDRAVAETGKFVVNTTAGVGGFIKVSDRFPKLIVPEEDIGQALGAWGVPAGPFLVLPVLGPANPREVFGRVGDYVLTPTTWSRGSIVPENWEIMDEISSETRLAVSALDALSTFPDLLNNYEALRKSAVDPYVSFRNGYLQYREAMIKK